MRFVNLNVASFDAHKLSAVAARRRRPRGPRAARRGARRLDGRRRAYRERATELAREWDDIVAALPTTSATQPLPAQSEVLGVVNRLSRPRDVVVCAAGSMPGDLHKLWRTRDPKGYHVEYGFSCMGYEIAGGLGVKMAVDDTGDDRDVFVMVGDGSYLMMAQELVTAVQEGVKLIVVLVQNHGFASIGALSESLGSQRFGTRYRYRTETGLDGDVLPVDLAANAASLGADVHPRRRDLTEFEKALAEAQAVDVHDRRPRRDRPAGPGPRQPGLVGRPGRRGLGAGQHPDRADGYERAQGAAAHPPDGRRRPRPTATPRRTS